jgi:hypothetical protein
MRPFERIIIDAEYPIFDIMGLPHAAGGDYGRGASIQVRRNALEIIAAFLGHIVHSVCGYITLVRLDEPDFVGGQYVVGVMLLPLMVFEVR